VTGMAPRIKLYWFTGSTPSLTVRLMLDHKQLAYKGKHVMVGPHAFSMLARGFQTMKVPALRIDGRRVQGSREISRALDAVQPEPGLFPADPQQRQAVEDAERFGEALQDSVRRIFWSAARRDAKAFRSVLRHPNPLMRPAQRVSRRLVTRLAGGAHGASDFAAQEDLARLPARLDQIDQWISEGLLNGAVLNAADFQVAAAVALLLRFSDLQPLIKDRRAAQLAQRVAPNQPGMIATTLPAASLATLQTAASRAAEPAPRRSRDTPAATGRDTNRDNGGRGASRVAQELHHDG